MAEECPVCDEPAEYREVVPAGDDGDHAGISIEVDDLCAAASETRWNRICPVPTIAEDGSWVHLEVYRHHWESSG